MKKKWSAISLVFFLIIAFIGTILRLSSLTSISIKYTNLVHAHSHVAFQGWVYTIIFLLLTKLFLKDNQIKKGLYPLQFKLTILVICGVLISFSLQGYGLYSIVFSTLFQLLNYWFIYLFFRDIKAQAAELRSTVFLKFIKTGLWLGLLSTLMPYIIGFLSAKGHGGTELYKSFIYTFLHLQYNGWFLFVAIGLFYKYLANKDIEYSEKSANYFYWLFTIAIIPSISLSLLGMSFSEYLLIPAYFSAVFLGFGLLYFLKSISIRIIFFTKQNKWIQLCLLVFLLSFVLKIVLQCLSVLPLFALYAFENKYIMLSYLHLSLIGVISFLFLALMADLKWLTINKYSKIGFSILITGFIVTELVLTFSGLGKHNNPFVLVVGSVAITLGILFLITSVFSNGKTKIYNIKS